MSPKILITDDHIFSIQPDGDWQTIDSVPQDTPIDLLVFSSDLDIKSEAIPDLSWLDRRRYIKQKQSHPQPGLFFKRHVISNQLITFQIHANDFVTRAIKSNQIRSIAPLVFECPDDGPLVIHLFKTPTGQIQLTVYKEGAPYYVKMSNEERLPDDLESVTTYLQHHFPGIDIDQLPVNSLTNLHDFKPAYHFHTHATSSKPIKVACAALLTMTAWQSFQSYRLSTDIDEINALKTSTLEDIRLAKAHVPQGVILPKGYKNSADTPQLMDLLKQVAGTLPDDMRVQALKFEAQGKKMTLHLNLESRLSSPSFEHAITHMRQQLKKWELHVVSLPYASAAHETFEGSSHADQLTLADSQQSAKIKLTGTTS